MLAIKGLSEWEYVTSQSVGISGGASVAVGGEAGSSITLKHKDKGTYKFWYASLGVGAGAGVKTPFKLPNPSGSFSLESYKSNGVLCLLEAFKGIELETSDITGYTLFLGLSAIAGVKGYSFYAMLLGIENVEKLLKEAYSDILQLGQTLGGGSQIVLNLQDQLGLFKNSAKAVLFMGGESAGLGLGATALGSVGYVWQGTPDKIGEVILNLKSVEEIPTPVRITAKDTTVITLPGDILFDWDKDFIKPSAYVELTNAFNKIMKYPNRRYRIIGYTDNTEKTPGHNQKLSERRAKSVSAYFTALSKGSLRFETEGRGATEFVADNDTEDGRAKNRRVEIYAMPN